MNLTANDLTHISSVKSYMQIEVTDIETKKEYTYYGHGIEYDDDEKKITVTKLLQLPVPLSEREVILIYTYEFSNKDMQAHVAEEIPKFDKKLKMKNLSIIQADTLSIIDDFFEYDGKVQEIMTVHYCLIHTSKGVKYALTGTVINPVTNDWGVMLVPLHKNPQFYRFEEVPNVHELVQRSPALSGFNSQYGGLHDEATWEVIKVRSIKITDSIKPYVEAKPRANNVSI